MLRKINAMYKLYGCVSWRTCKDCPYLIGYDYHGRHYYKCKAYGNTASEATDWRLYYHACGLIVMGMPTDHIPVLYRLKHGARGNDNQPIPGQITMFDEQEDDHAQTD